MNSMLLILLVVTFLAGMYYCAKMTLSKYAIEEGLTNMTNPRCPDILVQKDKKFFLYNSKVAKVPGVNPVEFDNLEDYVEFMDWQRSQGIRCPVLYLQTTYDAQGNIRIYDTKTMRGNNFTESYAGDSKNKFETERYGKSKKDSWTDQVSLYRILLNNTHGLKAKTIGALPIEISYNSGDSSTKKLNLLKGVTLSKLDTVKNAELEGTPSPAEKAPTTSLESLVKSVKEEPTTPRVTSSSQVIADDLSLLMNLSRESEEKPVPSTTEEEFDLSKYAVTTEKQAELRAEQAAEQAAELKKAVGKPVEGPPTTDFGTITAAKAAEQEAVRKAAEDKGKENDC
jgi:hypothetical protein